MKYRVYEPHVARHQRRYVLDALDSNELTYHGHYARRFEDGLKEALGASHVVTTTSGTTALYAAYKCLFGDKKLVLAPTMTYAATISQLILAGYLPVYYDCDEHFQADLNQVEDLLKMFAGELAGVVVAPLYADAPDMWRLNRLCQTYGVPLAVDAAEAFLCKRSAVPGHTPVEVGTYGTAATYSFFANKVMTTGEGGCVTTELSWLAEKLDRFCNHNTAGGYHHVGAGTNFRLTNLQAALGVAQLEDIQGVVARKKEVARYYRKHLQFDAVLPRLEDSSEWMPVFRLNDHSYEGFKSHCETLGVEVRPAFNPVHAMPGFHGLTPLPLDVAVSLPGRHFILPSHPSLLDSQLEEIVGVANAFLEYA